MCKKEKMLVNTNIFSFPTMFLKAVFKDVKTQDCAVYSQTQSFNPLPDDKF